MAQFHVYRLPAGPLVVDLQSDLISTGTRVVAPLLPISEGLSPLTRLEPIFEIEGERHARVRPLDGRAIVAHLAVARKGTAQAMDQGQDQQRETETETNQARSIG